MHNCAFSNVRKCSWTASSWRFYIPLQKKCQHDSKPLTRQRNKRCCHSEELCINTHIIQFYRLLPCVSPITHQQWGVRGSDRFLLVKKCLDHHQVSEHWVLLPLSHTVWVLTGEIGIMLLPPVSSEAETWRCRCYWSPVLWLFLLLLSLARPLMTLWLPLRQDTSWLEVCLPFMRKCCPEKNTLEGQKSRSVQGEWSLREYI